MTDRRPKKRQAEVPVKKIAILSALAAAGLLALSYLPLFDNGGRDDSQASPQGSALLNPVANDPLSVGATSAAGATSGNQVMRDWQPDTKTLPKKVESETVTAESTHYEGRRVVIADEVVEKLMKQPNVSGALPTAVVDELTGGNAQTSATQATAQASQVGTAAKTQSGAPAAKATKPAAPGPLAVPAPKVALTPVTTLNKKAGDHYSIQLIGASNTQAVDRFVADNALAGKVWVYQTRFRGSPWYVVLQGDYAGSAQAKAAIRKLSPALLKGQPWPKSFAQIQKELKQ